MTTTTKVLIGVGVLAVTAGVIYYFKNKSSGTDTTMLGPVAPSIIKGDSLVITTTAKAPGNWVQVGDYLMRPEVWKKGDSFSADQGTTWVDLKTAKGAGWVI